MATTETAEEQPDRQFTVDTREHGYSDGPANVMVELNPAKGGAYMAIVAAGVDGRYSFDFRISASGVKITKAYIEGMRDKKSGFPDWMDCVREEIEERFGVA